jgi:hypothetical protein
MLADGQWAVLEPLVEACRPKGKTPPHDLRRTVEAILWRHENGAKWRSVPAELGPWWMAAQTFIRWACGSACNLGFFRTSGAGIEAGAGDDQMREVRPLSPDPVVIIAPIRPRARTGWPDRRPAASRP